MTPMLLRRARTQQPQQTAVVDRANPITRGLRAIVVPGFPDAVTGTAANQIYGTTGFDVNPVGRVWAFNTSALEFSGVGYQAPPFTALVVVKKSTTVSESLITFGGSSTGYGWKIGSGGAADTFRLTYGGVADYNIVTNFWDIAGGITIAVLTVQGTSARLFKGGRLIASATVGTPKVPSKPLTLGAAFNSSNYTDLASSSIAAAAVWGRALSDVEAISVSENPWQLFSEASPVASAMMDALSRAAPTTPNSYTLTAAAGSFGLTGAAAGLRVSRRMTVTPGGLALTGSSAALRASRRLSAAAGTLALTGNPVALVAQRRLVVNAGSFGLSGAGASLKAARRLLASSGQYALSGEAASMNASRRLVAGPGTFVLSGSSVDMVYTPAAGPSGPTYTLSAASGAFGLVGAAAALHVSRRLAVDLGAFALAGQPAGLLAGRRLPAAPGDFSIAGAACALTVARRLPAQAGTFSLAGADAQLRYSAQVAYARAPTGAGYAPHQHYNETRPVEANTARPAALQRNCR